MKERPILFSAPMVRALLAGTKTQTRRVVKVQPEPGFIGNYGPGNPFIRGERGDIRCPYGQPGDRLWVRETWQGPLLDSEEHEAQFSEDGPDAFKKPGFCAYRATDTLDAIDEDGKDLGWRPSIHMPRWASRITLEITDVRVQRLQDIGEADAIAEGIERGEDFFGCPCWKAYGEPAGSDVVFPDDPIGSYASLWTSINGPGSWDANPWVWAIEFRRIAP